MPAPDWNETIQQMMSTNPTPDSEMTPEECQRKWELPYDHPESWVQENATYRQIYAAAHAQGKAEIVKIVSDVKTRCSADPLQWQQGWVDACETIEREVARIKDQANG